MPGSPALTIAQAVVLGLLIAAGLINRDSDNPHVESVRVVSTLEYYPVD